MLHVFSDTYKEMIPSDAPPSFRGQAVKYSYKITIGTQRLNHPTKLLRVPFRVLVLYGKLFTRSDKEGVRYIIETSL